MRFKGGSHAEPLLAFAKEAIVLDWQLISRSLPELMRGTLNTFTLTTSSIGIGLVLGTVLGMMRLSRLRPIGLLSSFYVWFFRGTPLLVQIFIIYYALPMAGISLTRWQAGIAALSLNTGAYIAEIVRAGVQSIDKGQTEAAQALGLTGFQTSWHIILPQTFRRIIPPLGNEFIALLKDSSLVSVIALEELLRKGQVIVTRSFKPIDIYLVVAVIYLLLTTIVSMLLYLVERRLGTSAPTEARQAPGTRQRVRMLS